MAIAGHSPPKGLPRRKFELSLGASRARNVAACLIQIDHPIEVPHQD